MGAIGLSSDLFNAAIYNCIDNCFRREGNEMTVKEMWIVLLSNSVGRIA